MIKNLEEKTESPISFIRTAIKKFNEIINYLNGNGIAGSYKVYTATLTQSGSTAPVATILNNTFTGTITWTRANTGDYTGTLTGAFTVGKVWVSIGNVDDPIASGNISAIQTSSVNAIKVYTGALGAGLGDNLLVTTPVEVRVYN